MYVCQEGGVDEREVREEVGGGGRGVLGGGSRLYTWTKEVLFIPCVTAEG